MRTILLSLLLALSILQTNAQTPKIGARLIGLTNTTYSLSNGWVPTDSNTYAYHDTETSDMKTGVYKYDSSIQYVYSASASVYNIHLKRTQGFLPSDSISNYDEYLWVLGTPPTWNRTKHIDLVFNNATGLDTTRIATDYTTNVTDFYKYYYNTSNLLSEMLHYKNVPPSTGFDTLEEYLYSYDGSNNLVYATHKHFMIPPDDSFVNSDQIEYRYDALNEDTMEIYSNWNMPFGPWLLNVIVKYKYDGSKRVVEKTTSSFSISTGLTPYSKDSIFYNSDGNVMMVKDLLYNTTTSAFEYNQETVWTYDTTWKNNPKVMQTYSWSGGTWQPLNGQDNQTRYWYEEYPTLVNTISKPQADLILYPVPATNFLNVQIKWNTPQAFTIAIFDCQGRLLMQQGKNATDNFKNIIPLSQLPAGDYLFRVSCQSGTISQHFNIIK
jgi:hypothetical protein